MTPLILGVACLIPAERLPHYHRLFEVLMGELQEGIFNAKPGYSNTSPMNAMGGQSHRGITDRQTPTTTDPDAEAATLDAPDLDLELGIGPEEITALCAAATFTCSDKSDAMARTVFEWTRGYLKVSSAPFLLLRVRLIAVHTMRRWLSILFNFYWPSCAILFWDLDTRPRSRWRARRERRAHTPWFARIINFIR